MKEAYFSVKENVPGQNLFLGFSAWTEVRTSVAELCFLQVGFGTCCSPSPVVFPLQQAICLLPMCTAVVGTKCRVLADLAECESLVDDGLISMERLGPLLVRLRFLSEEMTSLAELQLQFDRHYPHKPPDVRDLTPQVHHCVSPLQHLWCPSSPPCEEEPVYDGITSRRGLGTLGEAGRILHGSQPTLTGASGGRGGDPGSPALMNDVDEAAQSPADTTPRVSLPILNEKWNCTYTVRDIIQALREGMWG